MEVSDLRVAIAQRVLRAHMGVLLIVGDILDGKLPPLKRPLDLSAEFTTQDYAKAHALTYKAAHKRIAREIQRGTMKRNGRNRYEKVPNPKQGDCPSAILHLRRADVWANGDGGSVPSSPKAIGAGQ